MGGEHSLGLAFQLNCSMLMVLVSVFATNALDQLRKKVVSTGLKGWYCRPLVLAVADLPDSSVAVLLGAIVGMALKLIWGVKVVFSDELFFYVMLPPIIFYQGYSLKKKSFFRYIHYILALGLVGTLVQFFLLVVFISTLHRLPVLIPLPGPTLSLSPQEVLLLAALLTSCDEVATLSLIKRERHPKLWALLFGEGVLNDAVSILLFRSVLKGPRSLGLDTYPLTITLSAIYLLVLSTLIGLSIGLLLSRILKVAVSLREHPTRQCVVFILGAYLSFVTCEMLQVPGVLGVFFCGVVMSHFGWHSLAHEAQVGTALLSHSLASLAETYSFAALGLSVYRFRAADYSVRYTLILLAALLLSRALVVLLTFALGSAISPRRFSMDWRSQVVLLVAGQIRGVITWAQVLIVDTPHRQAIITTTLGVIMTTLLLGGAALPLLLRGLGLEQSATTDLGEMEGVKEEGAEREKEKGAASSDGAPPLSGVSGVSGVGPPTPRRLPLGPACSPLPPLPPAYLSRMSSVDSCVSGSGGGKDSGVLHGAVHRLWARLDDKYFKPIFGGRVRGGLPVNGSSACISSLHTPATGQEGDGLLARGREGTQSSGEKGSYGAINDA